MLIISRYLAYVNIFHYTNALITPTSEFAGGLAEVTYAYVDIRSRFVLQELGEAIVYAAAEEDEIAVQFMSGLTKEERTRYLQQLVEQSDAVSTDPTPSDQVTNIAAWYDHMAYTHFGDINGYELLLVGRGVLRLSAQAEETRRGYNLLARLAGDGNLHIHKRHQISPVLGPRRHELLTTEDDELIIIRAIGRLRHVNHVLSEQ